MFTKSEKFQHINNWFERLGRRIYRFKMIVLFGLLMLGVFCFLGLSKLPVAVSINSFFLDNDPVIISQKKFQAVFGNNDFVGVLIETDNIFSRKALQLIHEIGEDLKQNVPFAGTLISLTDIGARLPGIEMPDFSTGPSAEELTKYEAGLDALGFFRGRLYSTNKTQAWIILRLKEYPKPDAWTAKEEPPVFVGDKVVHLLAKYAQEGFTILPTGIPVVAYQRNVEIFGEMKNILIIASLIALVFIVLMTRFLQGILGTMLVTSLSIFFVFGSMGWLHIPADTTFILVPILLSIAVSVGYTIHLKNFFVRFFILHGDKRTALALTFKETGWPVLFTALTTILALVSFLLVPIQTIRWVGAVSSVSILVVYLLSILLFPAVVCLGKPARIWGFARAINRVKRRQDQKLSLSEDILIDSTFNRGIYYFSRFIIKRGKLLSALLLSVGAVIIVLFVLGILQVKVDLNTRIMLGLKLPHVRNQVYISDSELGMWSNYDIALNFKQANKIKDKEVIAKIQQFVQEIASLPMIKRVDSLLDMIKLVNLVMHKGDTSAFNIPQDQADLKSVLVLYKRLAPEEFKLWISPDYSNTRLLIEVADYSTKEIENQKVRIRQILSELFPRAVYPDFEYWLSGSTLQLSVMNQYITSGLILSIFSSIVIIVITMIIVFQSVRMGLIAMIPNIFPILVAGGLMGITKAPLEFVTMTIGPMVLGLSVDATIHFINHTRLEFARTGDYDTAVTRTFLSVGRAVTQTSLILCATFFAFTFARVNNMVNMGIYTIAAIAAAYVADFVITPTLIRVARPFDKLVNNVKKT